MLVIAMFDDVNSTLVSSHVFPSSHVRPPEAPVPQFEKHFLLLTVKLNMKNNKIQFSKPFQNMSVAMSLQVLEAEL